MVREMLPRAHFATVYAKPAGRPMVDTFVTEVSQDTWILFPWDTEPQYAPADRRRPGGRGPGLEDEVAGVQVDDAFDLDLQVDTGRADMVDLNDRVAAAVEVADLGHARERGLADEDEITDVADVDDVVLCLVEVRDDVAIADPNPAVRPVFFVRIEAESILTRASREESSPCPPLSDSSPPPPLRVSSPSAPPMLSLPLPAVRTLLTPSP